MATAIPTSNSARARGIRQLAQFPEECRIPVVGIKIRPRELLADFIRPSPALSVGMAVAGTAASIALYPMMSTSFTLQPHPADLLCAVTTAIAVHGCLHTLRHCGILGESLSDSASAAAALAQEQELRETQVELSRFEGAQPIRLNQHVQSWIVHAHGQYRLNEDGSTSLYVPKWRANIIAGLPPQFPNVPMTPVAIGRGQVLMVPTAALGNVRPV
jgi:hypothetical protein